MAIKPVVGKVITDEYTCAHCRKKKLSIKGRPWAIIEGVGPICRSCYEKAKTSLSHLGEGPLPNFLRNKTPPEKKIFFLVMWIISKMKRMQRSDIRHQ